MKLIEQLQSAATDVYIDTYYLQETLAVLVFLMIVIVTVMVAIL
jgi:hypothetical protein